jgi:NAD(P)-dependent dehydrogenase (short-subunit alcohol dehydrogenase family)
MGKYGDIKRLVASTVRKFGGVDIVVNNAGITGAAALASFLGQDQEHLDLVIDVNLKGPLLLAQEAARVMIKQKRKGVIINISSVAQFGAQEGGCAYCASKAGLDGFCKTAGLELATHGIRVVNVAPGEVDVAAHHDLEGILKRGGVSGLYYKKTPLGHRANATEVGKVVAFVASDDASFVTGCTWLVDGGWMTY